MVSLMHAPLAKTSIMVSLSSAFSWPDPVVALAWESISIRRTFLFVAASEAAKFTAVVVFPTPPFWLATTKVIKVVCYHFFGGLNSKKPVFFPKIFDAAEGMYFQSFLSSRMACCSETISKIF